MNGRNRRGIVISVIASAVIWPLGIQGWPLLTRSNLTEDGESRSCSITGAIVRDADGDWVSADIEEPQDLARRRGDRRKPSGRK